MDDLYESRPFSLRDHWMLLPIIVAAVLLRLWQINEPLWLDELHAAWAVSSGLTEVAERTMIGNQGPLFFYFPWITTSLFGMSEWALRLPSLVAGVALVAAAYGLAFQFTRSPIAASVCAILAVQDHNFLFYATETRPYAFVQLVAAAQLFVFWQAQAKPTARGRVAFVMLTVVLFYLHYTSILLVAGEVVFLSFRRPCSGTHRDLPSYRWRQLAVDLLCVVVMTSPTVMHLLSIGSRRGTWASFVNNTSLQLPVYWFSLVSYVVVPVIACAICGFVQAAVARRRDVTFRLNATLNGSSRPSVTLACLLFCWLFIPLTIVWLSTITDVARLYLGRYVIGAALAPILFAGLCVGIWGSKRLQFVVAASVIVYAIGSGGMIEQLRTDGRVFGDRAENWRDAVSFVNRDQRPNLPVFVRSGLLEADQLAFDDRELLRDYCVSPVLSIYRIDRPSEDIRPLSTSNSGELTNDDVKVIEASTEAWFIINGSETTRERCRDRVIASLDRESNIGVVSDERQFGKVGVFRVVLGGIDRDDRAIMFQPTSPNSIASP